MREENTEENLVIAMKKWTALLLALLLSLLCGCKQESTAEIFAMDTVMELTVYGPDAAEHTAMAAETVRRLERKLSVTDESSEVARLNAGETVTLSDETAELLRRGLALREETGGALDPAIYPVVRLWGFTTGEYRVPSGAEIAETLEEIRSGTLSLKENTAAVQGIQLDFGAVAKGYTGAVLAEALKAAGVTSALLKLGGSVQTVGTKPDGSPWRIAIRNPAGDENAYLGILEVGETAVITSGGYQRYFVEDGVRYSHILDPASGYPADSGLSSVTIVSEDGLLADGLSTALYVMGLEKAEQFWQSRSDFEAVLVEEDGTIHVTEGLEDCFLCDEFVVIRR